MLDVRGLSNSIVLIKLDPFMLQPNGREAGMNVKGKPKAELVGL